MKTRKLTVRQKGAISRIFRGISDAIDMSLAIQLERRGLVICHGVYERSEWNKVVARLRIVSLTESGRLAAL